MIDTNGQAARSGESGRSNKPSYLVKMHLSGQTRTVSGPAGKGRPREAGAGRTSAGRRRPRAGRRGPNAGPARRGKRVKGGGRANANILVKCGGRSNARRSEAGRAGRRVQAVCGALCDGRMRGGGAGRREKTGRMRGAVKRGPGAGCRRCGALRGQGRSNASTVQVRMYGSKRMLVKREYWSNTGMGQMRVRAECKAIEAAGVLRLGGECYQC